MGVVTGERVNASGLHKSSLSSQRKNIRAHISTDSFGIIFRVSGVLTPPCVMAVRVRAVTL